MIDDKAHNKPKTFAGFAPFFPSGCSDKELALSAEDESFDAGKKTLQETLGERYQAWPNGVKKGAVIFFVWRAFEDLKIASMPVERF